MPNNIEQSSELLDYQETYEREQNQQLGAKILSQAHFESSHRPIVESSFNKTLKKGEKLPGKNNERRNLSYLNRLSRLIEKYGNKAEQKLWQASIKDDLLIKEENITEATWEAKRQEQRDNGFGSIELTDELKHDYCKEWRELQKESLEKWVNYLGDEHSPYPLWFKVYAWGGMTKMGKYNKGKGKYEARNKTTVAPYPNPDAEVLAGVFDVINRYYGNGEKQFYTEEGERNIKLEQIVQSGSFPKIFNAIQQDIAPILEPPEKTEDVRGEWVEYELGDEDDIARAARGTGWCIGGSSSTARHYLTQGTYGQEAEHWDDNYGSRNKDSKSRFILFHLIDPSTGKSSRNAVASIRLDLDGNVAEISGLKSFQALNDSLVPIVEEKVKSLPGGEEFLPKFADKNKLIALDRKMQNGENLTKEELEFLYEIHRPIKILDTYNDHDPRIYELRQKFGIDYALDAGISIDNFVPGISPWDIVHNLDALISHGANIDALVSELNPFERAVNLDTLVSHGANIDIDHLVSKLGPDGVIYNLDTLVSHGANIDIDRLVSEMNPYDIIRHLDTLISHGTDINSLISSKMDSDTIASNLDALITRGAKIDIDDLVSNMDSGEIIDHLDTLLSHGASINIDSLISKVDAGYIIKYRLDTLISHGVNIDIEDIVSKVKHSYQIADNLDTLLSHGANIYQLVSKMDPFQINYHLETLINQGADVNQLIPRMAPEDVCFRLDDLIDYGAKIDIDELISKMHPGQINSYLKNLLNHGANIDQIISKMAPEDVADRAKTLLRHGADINQIISKIPPEDFDNVRDIFQHMQY